MSESSLIRRLIIERAFAIVKAQESIRSGPPDDLRLVEDDGRRMTLASLWDVFHQSLTDALTEEMALLEAAAKGAGYRLEPIHLVAAMAPPEHMQEAMRAVAEYEARSDQAEAVGLTPDEEMFLAEMAAKDARAAARRAKTAPPRRKLTRSESAAVRKIVRKPPAQRKKAAKRKAKR